MPRFSWIADDVLQAATSTFVDSIARSREENQDRMRRNVLDPFLLASMAHMFGAETVEEVLDYAANSTAVGSIGNALGRFHQQVLGGANGWRDHDRGFDLISDQRRLLAEVKNKHNTMNSSNRRQVEDDLKAALRQRESGWTAYLAIIIPKNPERYRTELAPNLFEVDGASFYEIVSEQDDALHDVLDYLCDELGVSAKIKDAVRGLDSLPRREHESQSMRAMRLMFGEAGRTATQDTILDAYKKHEEADKAKTEAMYREMLAKIEAIDEEAAKATTFSLPPALRGRFPS